MPHVALSKSKNVSSICRPPLTMPLGCWLKIPSQCLCFLWLAWMGSSYSVRITSAWAKQSLRTSWRKVIASGSTRLSNRALFGHVVKKLVPLGHGPDENLELEVLDKWRMMSQVDGLGGNPDQRSIEGLSRFDALLDLFVCQSMLLGERHCVCQTVSGASQDFVEVRTSGVSGTTVLAMLTVLELIEAS